MLGAVGGRQGRQNGLDIFSTHGCLRLTASPYTPAILVLGKASQVLWFP